MARPIKPENATPTTVHICAICGMGKDAKGNPLPNPQSRTLKQQLEALLAEQHPTLPITVRLSRCMGNCDDPITFALVGEGRETLVFQNGVTLATAEDIAQVAATYTQKKQGQRLTKPDMPQSLHGKVFARVPIPVKSK